jgi:hypothetical protein
VVRVRIGNGLRGGEGIGADDYQTARAAAVLVEQRPGGEQDARKSSLGADVA